MPKNRRDHLVDTALKLFCRDGFHATGIDTILAEAGVAKMTLYKHFKSKDELILAALRRQDEQFRNWFMRSVERRGRTSAERLVAIFDVLEERCSDRGYRGCAFINASAEYGSHDDPIHAVAAESKRLTCAYLRELAVGVGAQDPEELARQLMLLMEGAIVLTQVTGEPGATRQAQKAASVLIRHALGDSSQDRG